MPILTNPRRESFAQELAKGRPAYLAHKEAGLSGDRGDASKLQRDPSIVQRVEEIMLGRAEMARAATEKAAERLQVSVESLLEEAEEVRVAAMGAGQFAAAMSAIKEKGILAGVRVEKREQTHRTAEDLSDAELMAIARGERLH